MIDSLAIFKSRIRRDLLALFFGAPSRRYYLRELERLLGYSAGSIRRELLKFTKDRIFLTERVGNLVYYSLNTGHPLYEELKSLVSKTVGIAGSLKREISPIKGIAAAFIYGSCASGEDTAESDIDLMIIGDPDVSAVNRKLSRLENQFKRDINVSIHTVKEYRRRKKEQRGFILELLRRPKIMLSGDEDAL
jgi:predicted nucleotidyltransferase